MQNDTNIQRKLSYEMYSSVPLDNVLQLAHYKRCVISIIIIIY